MGPTAAWQRFPSTVLNPKLCVWLRTPRGWDLGMGGNMLGSYEPDAWKLPRGCFSQCATQDQVAKEREGLALMRERLKLVQVGGLERLV